MPRTKAGWGMVVLIAFLFLGTYFASRLTNLTSIPIFTDEAIYIRWSQIGAQDANWRFISLVDGKQPMFTWVMMVLFKLLPGDPLFIGRLPSVISGAISMVGLWFVSWELFKNKKVAFLSSILYLISPFSFVYDRMALYDSMTAMFYVWCLYVSVLLVRRLRLDIALILGMLLGAGMLNKTIGFLSLYLLPGTLLLFDWKKENRVQRLLRWAALVFVAALISQALYSVLRLSPLSHMIKQKDALFVYPMSEWITHPFTFFVGNMRGLLDWVIYYPTVPIFIASLFPILLLWQKTREKLLLYGYWLAPFIALALFGRVLYPRFIFFMTLPLLVTASLTVDWIMRKFRWSLFGICLLLIVFVPSMLTDYYLLFDPIHALIPQADRGQYINDWPVGWGVREVNTYLFEESKKGPLTIYTEGTFGLFPYAIEIYLVDKPNIEIYGIWPLPEEIPDAMVESARKKPTYVVINQMETTPLWPIELIASYKKGLRVDRTLRFYKVIAPQKETYNSKKNEKDTTISL